MRYRIALLALMAAGCSGKPEETAPAGVKNVVVLRPDRAAQPPVPIRGETPTGGEMPFPEAADPDAKPIPQDAAKEAAQRRERLDWHLRTSLGVYDKIGKKDPRWDDLVHKTIELVARVSSEPDSGITVDQLHQASKAAVDAGCDDPLVANVYARTLTPSADLSKEEISRRQRDAALAYAASGYPAYRRAGVLENLASELIAERPPADDAARKEIEGMLDTCLALLSEAAKSDEHNMFWENKWHDTVIGIIRDFRALGVPAQDAYERADAKMADVSELEVIRLMVRGSFWFSYGWEARTQAFSPNVPAGGFRSLGERMAIAKEAFEQAWKLRPENSYSAAHLMEIDKAVGGDRPTMELWFERAMTANADARDACWTKLDWLDPKWHGTPGEMLAFGRQCRDTKNWRAGITLLCAEAHWRIVGLPGVNQNTYLAIPEVWADIQSVYEEYLKHYPNDSISRSKYATYCHLSGHYRLAEEQYVAVGDKLSQWTEFPYVPLIELKQNRERNARIVMGEDGLISIPGWHFVKVTIGAGQWNVNTPVEAPHQEKPGILGSDVTHVWDFSNGGITYRIRMVSLPPSRRDETLDHILDEARAVVARERNAQPQDVHDTLLAARPAQEYDLDLKPRPMRVKSTVIDNRYYELSVIADKKDLDSRDAREFFASFAYRPTARPFPEAGGQ